MATLSITFLITGLIIRIIGTCNSLKAENKIIHEKLDLLIKNADITFINDEKRKEIQNSINQLYADGDVENASKLEKTLNPLYEKGDINPLGNEK